VPRALRMAVLAEVVASLAWLPRLPINDRPRDWVRQRAESSTSPLRAVRGAVVRERVSATMAAMVVHLCTDAVLHGQASTASSLAVRIDWVHGDARGALVMTSALVMVMVATSSRLPPNVGFGCGAAATRCRASDLGSVSAVPPPLFAPAGRVTLCQPKSATRCLVPLQVFADGRDQRELQSLPS
jgi:hypothetical protein